MYMNLTLHTVMQEKQRIDSLLRRYQEILDTLPRGTISEKSVNGRTYYYLKYREGGKVVSKYVGREDIDSVRQQIDRRRHIETMIRSLRDEQATASKILEGRS